MLHQKHCRERITLCDPYIITACCMYIYACLDLAFLYGSLFCMKMMYNARFYTAAFGCILMVMEKDANMMMVYARKRRRLFKGCGGTHCILTFCLMLPIHTLAGTNTKMKQHQPFQDLAFVTACCKALR